MSAVEGESPQEDVKMDTEESHSESERSSVTPGRPELEHEMEMETGLEMDADQVQPPMPKRAKTESRENSSQPTDEEEEEEAEDEEDVDDEDNSEEDEHHRHEDVKNTSLKLNESEHAPLSNVDKLINVGTEYQAVVYPDPMKSESPSSRELSEERDELIWTNPEDLDDSSVFQYVGEAAGRFRMPIDRALFVLKSNDYDAEKSLIEVERRREMRDIWSLEESSLFSNCFFHFGKRFKKIQSAMPHRSLSSIIQYYYDSKKKNQYKTIIDVRLNENDAYDELCEEIRKIEKVMAGLCENCNEKTDILIKNSAMERLECKTCVLYFRMMRVPRPTEHSLNNRNRVNCPEYMKHYVLNYVELTKPADGMAVERLKVGKKKEPVDEDCLVIEECPLRKPSALYIIPNATEYDDPADANTCRHTRDFESAASIHAIDHIRRPSFMCVPLIWRHNETRCMEDCEVLNEEARRRIQEANAAVGRVNMEELNQWKSEMDELKVRQGHREDEDPEDELMALGTRSGRVRYDQNWTIEEKKDVVRCFHWYRDDFEMIAEVMGTKTPEQVAHFYKKNEDVINKSIDLYLEAVRAKIEGDSDDDMNDDTDE